MNTDVRNKKIVAVVTGSSSGIGFETSLLLAKNGFFTYATMRNLDKSDAIIDLKQKEKLPLEVLKLDVTNDKSVKEAMEKIVNEQETIDVLVNNAGYALVGALEELSIEEFKEQFETNVFGVIRVVQEILPIMRKQRHGTIVNISSLAGKIGFPLTSAYVSSKFALEGLSESMAYEVEQFGIKVILIEPGVIKTNFDKNLKIGKKASINTTTNNSNSPYADITEKRIAGFKPRFESGSSPIEVAKVILKALTSKNPPSESRYMVGDDAFKLMEIRKKKSDKEFRKLVMEGVLK
ncbi:MAG TPA: SDR family oxidoreductase [Nitrososphaeraceae archaeon]|jgi:NAD(P)-dependent dehydrogenase (short-subunit alcohol dehydrogenase family)|nr:SDR family oxidoreductase [Nitrososphaeraceae archaeon]